MVNEKEQNSNMTNKTIENSQSKKTLSNNASSSSSSSSQKEEQIVETIPLYEEDFELTKKGSKASLHLEKKWKHHTKKIEIPIRNEEIFVNGKELNSYDENEIVELFSNIKDKISDALHLNNSDDNNQNFLNNKDKKQQQKQKQQNPNVNNELDFKYHKHDSKESRHSPSSLPLPLPHPSSLPSTTDQEKSNPSLEKIIPLFGEQITINRKIVKVGEVVIRKYQITEKHEIEVELEKERMSTKVPHGFDVQEI